MDYIEFLETNPDELAKLQKVHLEDLASNKDLSIFDFDFVENKSEGTITITYKSFSKTYPRSWYDLLCDDIFYNRFPPAS